MAVTKRYTQTQQEIHMSVFVSFLLALTVVLVSAFSIFCLETLGRYHRRYSSIRMDRKEIFRFFIKVAVILFVGMLLAMEGTLYWFTSKYPEEAAFSNFGLADYLSFSWKWLMSLVITSVTFFAFVVSIAYLTKEPSDRQPD